MVKRLAPLTKRVTLRDVAAVAGVDPSAVSRVVNNDSRLSVSDATRQRILTAVAELGYRPNLNARGLRSSKTWTICFILPNISNPMYEPIVRSVERAAEERGYAIVLGSRIEGRSAENFANLLQEGRVDGLLVASSTLHDDFLREAVAHGPGPVILVNRRVDGVASSVVVDDEGASRTAVEYLHSLGHRTIGGIFGPKSIDTAVRRQRGFSKAIKRAGVRSVVVGREGWNAEDGYSAALEIIRKHPRVTAIYASTFLMGLGVLRAAAEEGRQIPADLSVVCLHDSPLAEYLVPPLTAIRLPTDKMGEQAVNLLVARTEGAPDQAIMVEGAGEIVERGSAGPAPLHKALQNLQSND